MDGEEERPGRTHSCKCRGAETVVKYKSRISLIFPHVIKGLWFGYFQNMTSILWANSFVFFCCFFCLFYCFFLHSLKVSDLQNYFFVSFFPKAVAFILNWRRKSDQLFEHERKGKYALFIKRLRISMFMLESKPRLSEQTKITKRGS